MVWSGSVWVQGLGVSDLLDLKSLGFPPLLWCGGGGGGGAGAGAGAGARGGGGGGGISRSGFQGLGSEGLGF